jgi:arabinose-5-phosphate isomerase
MLAMGDALALTVSKAKGFKKEHLATLHPLGAIGKILTMRVSDIMRKGKGNPIISEDADVKETILLMTSTAIGAAIIVDKKGKLKGFFTDGDLRRKLQKDKNILEKKISEVMTKNPKTLYADMMASEAGLILKKYKIDNIPVVDKNNKPVGILDEGDILSEGLLK